jgi:penicillin-insensitive murein DD-endopeptidase
MKWFWWVAVVMWSLGPSVSAAFTWSDVIEPVPGMPRAIGSYTAGCVQGAVPLPLEGPGFQTMRPSRRRFYGHPDLIRYIHRLGEAAAQRGLGVLAIGDLGQPRGGPMLSGHRSHQSGLDVDIWFWIPPLGRVLPAAERDAVAAPSMLAPDRRALDGRQWSTRQADMLRLAIGFDVVARAFVHPVIKKTLCEQFPGAPWLQKLRPWWGHDDHFHVRLRCPMGESECHNQDVPPAGDGCGAELAWWFSEEARQPPPRIDRAEVPLPEACEDILRR